MHDDHALETQARLQLEELFNRRVGRRIEPVLREWIVRRGPDEDMVFRAKDYSEPGMALASTGRMAKLCKLLLCGVAAVSFSALGAEKDDGFVWIDANTKIKVKTVGSAAAGTTAPETAPEPKKEKKEKRKK